MSNSYRLLTLSFFIISCHGQNKSNREFNSSPSSATQPYNQQVVYGTDDRKDLYKVLDPIWVEKARSTFALIAKNKVKKNGNTFSLRSQSLGVRFSLCPGEKFYNQPSAAFCSGFLIGPRTAVTAGHCMTSEDECKKHYICF